MKGGLPFLCQFFLIYLVSESERLLQAEQKKFAGGIIESELKR